MIDPDYVPKCPRCHSAKFVEDTDYPGIFECGYCDDPLGFVALRSGARVSVLDLEDSYPPVIPPQLPEYRLGSMTEDPFVWRPNDRDS